MTGEVQLVEPLTPGLSLIYDSGTLPRPVIVLETFLQDSSDVPDEITAQLTFNSTAGTAYTYDTTSLSAGDALRFALQADATALASGRYAYSVKLTADLSSTLIDHTYSGSRDIVNRGGSAHPFGRGWQLAGLDELVIDTSGVLWVQADGDAIWFEEDGSGGYERADGDVTFSTLVENIDNTFTLTDKYGIQAHFSSAGLLTSREDRNGNTLTYTYTSGLLTKITDAVNRDTTFTYTSGQLTSVTDFASRTATLTYDGSGRLTKITQPDPDGAGAQAAPETEFTYDATSHQLTKVTNPLDDDTQFQYGSHGRLTKITFPDTKTWQLVALQTIGLPAGTTGNGLTAANPNGTITDERGKVSEFQTDRFGNTTKWIDQLDHVTRSERNADGLLTKLTNEDPDGTGPLIAPVTILGYDSVGNIVFRRNANSKIRTWTYTTAFNQTATETDELSNAISFTYDSNGNRTKFTDQASNETTYAYNSAGLVTSITAPDPDGAGPLSAAVTSFSYDSNRRLTTLTNPDSTTRTFTYDTADNLLTETDELSNTATFVYDALNRLTSSTDREAAETAFVYDAASNKTRQTDALGGETDYEYNSRGWVTKITYPDPDGAGSLARPASTYGYDGAGNLTSQGEPNMMGASSTHTYDDAGRRTQTQAPGFAFTNYTYDALGRLTKVVDPLNHDTHYRYDVLGQLIETEGHDPDGSGGARGPITQYAYSDLGQLVQVTDPRGYSTYYQFDARGLLTWTTAPDPDGSGPQTRPVTRYDYDNLGRLTEVRDSLSRTTKFEYNNRDWLTKQTQPDPDGAGSLASPVTTFGYDAVGNRTSVTDPLNRVTTFAFDDAGRVLSVTQPDPDGAGSLAAPVTSVTYDDLGNLLTTTDPLGNVTSFEYDGLSRRTKVTAADPDGAGSLTAPVTTYTYNEYALTMITDPLGQETTFQYDGSGRRSGVTDHAGKQTSYTYDKADNVLSVTLPDPDGGGPLTAPVTSYLYDLYNRVSKVTDPAGATNFTYDAAGNLLTLKDPVNNTTTWAYDGLGRVTIETNALSKSRSFDYDAAGNLARRTDRNGQVQQFEYDDLDRRLAEKWFDSTAKPALAIVTNTEGGPFDEIQRVGFSSSFAPISGGTFTLSFNGQTTSAIGYNASAETVLAALEALSTIGTGDVAVTKITDTSTKKEWRVTFGGSLAGTNVNQITINVSNVQTMMGPPTKIEATDTQGGNGNEQQTVTLTSAGGGTFRLAFEGETSKPLAYNASAATVEAALEELNAVDNVTVTGSAGGPWAVTFVGDHSGLNVPSMTGDAATLTNGTLIRTISYVYDAASQLTSADDPDSSYAYTYDNLGRVLTVDNDGTPGVPQVVLTSAYDANGNRTSLSAVIDSADDFVNSYTYDNLNRLTRLDQAGQSGGNTVAEKRVDFAYNARGQFTSLARFNDTDGGSGDEVATSAYTYDTLGRLTGLSYKNGGTNLFTPYAWTYDNMHRITQFVSADGTSDYTYDSAGQLTAADHDYQSDESYSYDANGNRTMTGYSTGTNNRLLNDGTFTYTYDNEGNRLTRTNDTTDEATEYEWDYRNRLVQVTDKDEYEDVTQVVEYTYDLFNRRISRSVDTTSPFDMSDAAIESYVYDDMWSGHSVTGNGPNPFALDTSNSNVILDFLDPDGSGSQPSTLNSRLLFGPAVDQILAQEDVTESLTSADRVLWPLADHLGSVRDLAKNDGTLGEHYEYDSYGNIISGDTSLTRYLFTSRDYDEATGLQYNRARWYDADAGRWISEDPIGFGAGDPNINRYVMNGPTAHSDPGGLQEFGPDYATEPVQAAAYMDWLYQGADVGTITTGWWTRLFRREFATEIAMLQNPTSVVFGAWQGVGHGAAMVANAATFHQIDSLNQYVNTIVGQNGGVYGVAYVSAHVGVYSAYVAGGYVGVSYVTASSKMAAIGSLQTTGRFASKYGYDTLRVAHHQWNALLNRQWISKVAQDRMIVRVTSQSSGYWTQWEIAQLEMQGYYRFFLWRMPPLL